MSDSYYVRSQGKVHGPFSIEDLKTKAAKGHLKKTHQVSTDQKSWQPARRMQDVFPPPKPPEPKPKPEPINHSAKELDFIEVQLLPDDEEESLELVEVDLDEDTEWHYCLQGDEQTQGPFSEANLRSWFHSGQLPLNTLVWNESLNDWVEAGQFPAFRPARTAAQPQRRQAMAAEIPLVDPTFPMQPVMDEGLPVPPLASASIILGILGIAIPIGVASVLAIVFGHMSMQQIKADRRNFQGDGTAKTGMILGYIGLAVFLIVGIVLLIVKIVNK